MKCAWVILAVQIGVVGHLAAQDRGPSWWPAVAVVGAIGVASVADRGLNVWMQDHRSSGSDAVARVFRQGGQPGVVLGIGGGIVAAGLVSGRPALQRSGGRVLASVAAAGLTTAVIKRVTGRQRPVATDDPFRFRLFSDHDSFASGHAALAFALATSLAAQIKNRWASAAFYSFATGTAWSRMNDRRHWFSDVLAGAAIGFTAAQLIERHPPRFLAERNGARLEWSFAW